MTISSDQVLTVEKSAIRKMSSGTMAEQPLHEPSQPTHEKSVTARVRL